MNSVNDDTRVAKHRELVLCCKYWAKLQNEYKEALLLSGFVWCCTE